MLSIKFLIFLLLIFFKGGNSQNHGQGSTQNGGRVGNRGYIENGSPAQHGSGGRSVIPSQNRSSRVYGVGTREQNGSPGADGIPGQNGSPRADGIPGQNGSPGTNGLPGQNGSSGTNGLPGRNGSPLGSPDHNYNNLPKRQELCFYGPISENGNSITIFANSAGVAHQGRCHNDARGSIRVVLDFSQDVQGPPPTYSTPTHGAHGQHGTNGRAGTKGEPGRNGGHPGHDGFPG